MSRRLLRVALGRLQDAFHILGLGAKLGEQLLHGTAFLFHTVAHRPKIIREFSPAIEWGETRGLRLIRFSSGIVACIPVSRTVTHCRKRHNIVKLHINSVLSGNKSQYIYRGYLFRAS